MPSKSMPISPDDRLDFNLPDKLKLCLADCITTFAKIESCIVETIWLLEKADLEKKKQISKEWSSKNFKYLQRVIAQIPGARTDAIWPALKAVAEDRNLMAHGVWMTINNRPHVVWHRKFLESEDYVTGEWFDYARFEQFMKRAGLLLQTFSDFKNIIQEP